MDVNKEINWITEAIDSYAETSIRRGEYWRAPYTPEDKAAADLLQKWMEERGMTTYFDSVGNLFGRIEGKEPGVIMTGSHRDTVRHGGKYSGALGMLCSIEAVGALCEELGQPQKTVEVVATVEEEGFRFFSSFIGSRAIIGKLTEDDLKETDDNGMTLEEAITEAGYYHGELPKARTDIEHFLELDTEQGAVMERSGKNVGLVQSIVGLKIGKITIRGERGHAGTYPMSMRADAVPLAAKVIVDLTRWAKNRNDRVACTFGNVEVSPGKTNIIADEVVITFDIRSTNESLINEAESMLKEFQRGLGRGLSLEYEVAAYDKPADMDMDGVFAMRDIAAEEGMKYMRINSGAAHDSQIIAQIAPSNMIFVPSHDGIALTPMEYTSPESTVEGYTLLKKYLQKLAW